MLGFGLDPLSACVVSDKEASAAVALCPGSGHVPTVGEAFVDTRPMAQFVSAMATGTDELQRTHTNWSANTRIMPDPMHIARAQPQGRDVRRRPLAPSGPRPKSRRTLQPLRP